MVSVVCCWSAKGGVGATVLAAGIAMAACRLPARPGVVLVDLAGDLPLTLGIGGRQGDGPGVADWLARGPAAPPDALARIERSVDARLALVPRGAGALDPAGVDLLLQVLSASGRLVVIDAGCLPQGGVTFGAAVTRRAGASLLVSGTDAVALARAERTSHRATGVVLVGPGRPADRRRVASAVLPAPVVATMAFDPRVRAAVANGLARTRLPNGFRRTLDALALAISPAIS